MEENRNIDHLQKMLETLSKDLDESRKQNKKLEERLDSYIQLEPIIQTYRTEHQKRVSQSVNDVSNYLKELPVLFEEQQGKTPYSEKLAQLVNGYSDDLKNKADKIFLNKQADETLTVLNACASAAQIRSSTLQKWLSQNTKLSEENDELKKIIETLKNENNKLLSEYNSLNTTYTKNLKTQENNINVVENHVRKSPSSEVVTATASSDNKNDVGISSLWSLAVNDNWKSITSNYEATY